MVSRMTKAENSRVAQSDEPSADRIAADLTANDIEVIRERHFGWEQAAPGTLAAIFGVSVQRINAILRKPKDAAAIISPGAANADSAQPGGGHDKRAAPVCNSCGHANCPCTDWGWDWAWA